MLLNRNQCCLLVIDIQEKLTPSIYQHELLIKHCSRIINITNDLDIPIILSEQYPKGLGHTVSDLNQLIQPDVYLEKLHFSCTADKGCWQKIQSLDKTQFIIIGIEAHVCVMQTVLGIHQLGKQCFVIDEATSSRDINDKKLAIDRMRQAGAEIISTEMMLFECLHQSGTEEFKTLSKRYLQN